MAFAFVIAHGLFSLLAVVCLPQRGGRQHRDLKKSAVAILDDIPVFQIFTLDKFSFCYKIVLK